jgi:hypothetical protein
MATKPKRARSSTGGVNWSAQLESDLKYAEEALIREGQVIPTFVLHTKARALVIVCPWDDETQKHHTYLLVELMCIVEDAIGLTFLGESWMTDAPNIRPGETQAEFDGRIQSVIPETDEGRREIVMVQTSYRDRGGAKMAMYKAREIVRGADGQPTGLIPLPQLLDPPGAMTHVSGRVYDILPDEPPTPEERQAARAKLLMLRKQKAH